MKFPIGASHWFADVGDSEDAPRHRDGSLYWQPCVQSDGLCVSIDIWFDTEPECVRFIRQIVALPIDDSVLTPPLDVTAVTDDEVAGG